MTIHHAAGGPKAGLAGSLPGFRSCVAGSWKILARPHYVEIARSFLAPLPVESLLAAFEEGDAGLEGSGAQHEVRVAPSGVEARGGAGEGGTAGATGADTPAAGGTGWQRVSIPDDKAGGGAEDLQRGVEVSPGRLRKGAGDSGVDAEALRPTPPRGRMATLEVDCGEGTTLVVKALKRGGLPARLRGGYHGSPRLLAEMAILEEALRREIPTARLAFGATGRLENGSEVAILATERIPGAVSLGHLLGGATLSAEPATLPARRRSDARTASRGTEAASPGVATARQRSDPAASPSEGEPFVPASGRESVSTRTGSPSLADGSDDMSPKQEVERAAGVPDRVQPNGADQRMPARWEATLARRQAIRAAGAAVGKAHELGLDHADLNLGNVLLRRDGGAWSGFVIDLGLSAIGPSLGVRRRAANLVRLLRSVEKHLGSDPRRVRDSAAFLQGYLSTIPAPRRRRRRDLLVAVRRGLPSILLHRLGWSLLGGRAKRI